MKLWNSQHFKYSSKSSSPDRERYGWWFVLISVCLFSGPWVLQDVPKPIRTQIDMSWTSLLPIASATECLSLASLLYMPRVQPEDLNLCICSFDIWGNGNYTELISTTTKPDCTLSTCAHVACACKVLLCIRTRQYLRTSVRVCACAPSLVHVTG